MYRRLALLIFMLITSSAVAAQEGYPLPTDLPPITPANAAQVRELVSVGGDLPGGLAWSPDGKLLAAGTSAGVKMYDASDLTKAPIEVVGGQDVLFSPDGSRLLSGGKLWDTKTWQAVATIGDSDTRMFSPSGKLLLTTDTEDGKVVASLWSADDGGLLNVLHTDSSLVYIGAVFNSAESQIALQLVGRITHDELASGVVQLWDARTGKLIVAATAGYEDLVKVAFGADDGVLIVSSVSDAPYGGPVGDIQLWDALTGKQLKAMDYAFDPVISPDSTVMIYNRNTDGFRIMALNSFVEMSLDGIDPVFSPDGKRLASLNYSKEGLPQIILQEMRGSALSNTQMINPEISQMYVVPVLAFSPDGKTLVAIEGSQIHSWNVETQTTVRTFDTGFNSEYDPNDPILTFSPDGSLLRVLIYGQGSSFFQFWDVQSGKMLGTINDDYKVISSPNWKQFVSWDNGRVHVKDILKGTDTSLTVIKDFVGHVSDTRLNLSSGDVLFYGDHIRVYGVMDGKEKFQSEADSASTSGILSTNGQQVMLYSSPTNNPDSVKIIFQNIQEASQPPVRLSLDHAADHFTYSPDGSLVAASFPEGNETAEGLYDSREGGLLAQWRTPIQTLYSSWFTPDGKYLILGAVDNDGRRTTLTFWDVNQLRGEAQGEGQSPRDDAKPRLTLMLTTQNSGEILDLTFSPDGLQLAISIDDVLYGEGTLDAYRVDVFKMNDLLKLDGSVHEEDLHPNVFTGVYTPRFSSHGRYLITSEARVSLYSTDTIRLWNIADGKNVATLDGDGAATLSPDNMILATHDTDGIVLWDLAALVKGEQTPLVTLTNTDSDVKEVAFNADGTLLFARSNNRVSVWGVSG